MRVPNPLLILVSGMTLLAAVCAPDREPAHLSQPAPGNTYARETLWLYSMSPDQIESVKSQMGNDLFRKTIERQTVTLERYGLKAESQITQQIRRDYDACTTHFAGRTEL